MDIVEVDVDDVLDAIPEIALALPDDGCASAAAVTPQRQKTILSCTGPRFIVFHRARSRGHGSARLLRCAAVMRLYCGLRRATCSVPALR
jgi:hypothetical protein